MSIASKLVSLYTLLFGEDVTRNRILTLPSFNYTRLTASGQVKASAGFIHALNFSATGIVVADVITVYDNSAGSGTIIWSGIIATGINPITVILDVETANGISVVYGASLANVQTTVSWL